jgi:NAD(P)-dependent dehydrogenase (short-subunit alcohol dehydrogenase family)
VAELTLHGRRILLVGGSSGIGRAIGIAAAAVGASVAFAARRRDRLDAAVAEDGPPAVAVVCDVTDPDSIEDAVSATVEALGGLDSVVYATGVDPLVRIEDVDAGAWARLMATNVIGASLVIRAALPHLRPGGRVVLISATSVGRPLPGMGADATSKAALEELARAWRSEHPDVGFCTVAVGMTPDTEVMKAWDPALLAELGEGWDRRGHLFDNGPGYLASEDVAAAVVGVLAVPALLPYVSVLADPASAAATS